MIISASRRTDIPAFYCDWFFERVREGYADVKNPFNAAQVKRVSLKPEDVECIVFWTKNPSLMLGQVSRLSGFDYYFLFTITGYGRDVEPNIPSKDDTVLPAFLRLADAIGPGRVVWRYDPVFLSPKYTLACHLERFEKLARKLCGYTEKCVISFMDVYRNTRKNMLEIAPEEWTDEKMREAAKGLSEIAFSHGIGMETCAEKIDLSGLGIGHASCIDKALIERITGKRIDRKKDRYQRPECGCAGSVDIGAYHTCPGGCRYCYANDNAGLVKKNMEKHDEKSPALCAVHKKDPNADTIV